MTTFTPIGSFLSAASERYELARQAGLARCTGVIELCSHCNYEIALADLAGFERIWVFFHFDRNTTWKPKVLPPRGGEKRGVFATRSPHRPNPLGISCVELLRIEGRRLYVGSHDLLDQTPILDIKPYIPATDSFPESRAGWVDELPTQVHYDVTWEPTARTQANYIIKEGGPDLRKLTQARLELEPEPYPNRRVRELGPDLYELAHKTWRLVFRRSEQSVSVIQVNSAYSDLELEATEDRWNDKALHRKYLTSTKL